MFCFVFQIDAHFISTDPGDVFKYNVFKDLRAQKIKKKATESILCPSESAVFVCSPAVRKDYEIGEFTG